MNCESKRELLEEIPFRTKEEAALIINEYINESGNIEDTLKYTVYLKGKDASELLEKAYRSNAGIYALIDGITPNTNVEINDKIVDRALKENAEISIIIEKAIPFISDWLVDEIVCRAITDKYDVNKLVKYTVSYASDKSITNISEYAINSNARINTIDAIYPYAIIDAKKELDAYREKYINEKHAKKERINNIYDTVKNIFIESGIEFDENNPDELLDIDSLHSISIICEIEDAFDILVPEEYLEDNQLMCISDYVNMIEQIIANSY